jgi:glutamyl-Q tRNA(Asp) synthetase
MSPENIIGRFAPSPTGPLHFGSLSCALASYLDIKKLGGSWLVRMEDIDPPREIKGASSHILKQLEAHGLCWDGNVLFQSTRLNAYQDSLNILEQKNLAYNCECSRQRVNALQGIYDNHCRRSHLPSTGNATRVQLNQPNHLIEFVDQIAGQYAQSLAHNVGDFIIRRRDNLFSYQLAVTVDDQYQNITHVMRGSDLLDSTPRQIYLQRCLEFTQPQYAHLPLATNPLGQKLSKQNLASTLIPGQETLNIWAALNWLNQSPPNDLKTGSVSEILTWAISHWDSTNVNRSLTMPAPEGF